MFKFNIASEIRQTYESSTMVRAFILGLLLLLTTPVRATDINLYFIHPDGEGDSESARPYLANLYAYLSEHTQTTITGQYLNDSDDAVEALTHNKVQLAIVTPEFFDKYQSQFNFKKVLQTIPTYSGGPYEKYYIMAHQEVNILELMHNQAKIELVGSKSYNEKFLNDKIFLQNDEIKKISWKLQRSEQILDTIKVIADGSSKAFVLLTGYEFSVINSLKQKNKDFAKLKLVFSSRELPSSALVLIGSEPQGQWPNIKKTLLAMPASLQGNLVLKKLRLKGFAEL